MKGKVPARIESGPLKALSADQHRLLNVCFRVNRPAVLGRSQPANKRLTSARSIGNRAGRELVALPKIVEGLPTKGDGNDVLHGTGCVTALCRFASSTTKARCDMKRKSSRRSTRSWPVCVDSVMRFAQWVSRPVRSRNISPTACRHSHGAPHRYARSNYYARLASVHSYSARRERGSNFQVDHPDASANSLDRKGSALAVNPHPRVFAATSVRDFELVGCLIETTNTDAQQPPLPFR